MQSTKIKENKSQTFREFEFDLNLSFISRLIAVDVCISVSLLSNFKPMRSEIASTIFGRRKLQNHRSTSAISDIKYILQGNWRSNIKIEEQGDGL